MTAPKVEFLDVAAWGAPHGKWEPGSLVIARRGNERACSFHRRAAPPLTECTGAIRIEPANSLHRMHNQDRRNLYGPGPEGHSLIRIVDAKRARIVGALKMPLTHLFLVPNERVEEVVAWFGENSW